MNLIDIRITGEYRSKAIFHHHGDLQIRARLLQQGKRGLVSTQSPSDRKRMIATRAPDGKRSSTLVVISIRA